MPIQEYKMDPKLGGLHNLANSRVGSYLFNFQLPLAEEQTTLILSNFEKLVKNTKDNAPERKHDFCLARVTDPKLTYEEDKWERAMYEKWGPRKGPDEYVPICKHIQTYQYPIRATRKDSRWGEIDLLGIGADFLPVPNELKKRKAKESPLRMLVEVAAYGVAIRKVWPNLREHWAKAPCRLEGSPSQFPPTLDRVTLVGVAPEEYWRSCTGRPRMIRGAFPTEAWPCFWHLVDRLKPWFEIHFVALEGKLDDGAGLPTIAGAHELDLKSLTMKSAAGTPYSAQ
jgi:hypothetical protein